MFEDQAIPVRLRMVAPIPRRIEALQSLRDELMDNGESGYSFEKVFGEYVDCFRGKEYINYSLIERGMSKSVHLVVPNELKQKLKAIEEKSRASHIGVWEQSEEEESDDE